MYNILLGILLACIAGSVYSFLFWHSHGMRFFKKGFLAQTLLFIARMCFLLLCYKLTLKIIQIDAIVFMFGFLIAYTLTIGSLQRKI